MPVDEDGELDDEDEPVDGEPVLGDDELPSWDSLPPEWKSRYSLQRDLGRYEYTQALKREQVEHKMPGPRGVVGRFSADRLGHPGLRGGP
jgi:hypothetical protein